MVPPAVTVRFVVVTVPPVFTVTFGAVKDPCEVTIMFGADIAPVNDCPVVLAFEFKAIEVAVEIGLSKSLVLSTYSNPTSDLDIPYIPSVKLTG